VLERRVVTTHSAIDTAPATVVVRRAAGLRPLLWAAGLTTIAAAALHVVAAAQHAAQREAVVGFFLLAAGAQMAGGLWLVVQAVLRSRPDPRLFLAGLVATTALVMLFVVVHTTDLVLFDVPTPAGHGGHESLSTGPFAGGAATRNDTLDPVREAAGLLGMLTVALELVTITALTVLQPRRRRGQVLNALLALGALGWLAWLTGIIG
jgi:hypothetical protein